MVIIDAVNGNEKFMGQLGAGRIAPAAAVAAGPPMPALGDLNADGLVGTADLLNLLAAWRATHSSADLTGDGVVNTADLLLLLDNWG